MLTEKGRIVLINIVGDEISMSVVIFPMFLSILTFYIPAFLLALYECWIIFTRLSARLVLYLIEWKLSHFNSYLTDVYP